MHGETITNMFNDVSPKILPFMR